jgi:hypothetical protein
MFKMISFMIFFYNKKKYLPGMVAHACNPSTQEAEAVESWVQGQSILHRLCLKRQRKNRKEEGILLQVAINSLKYKNWELKAWLEWQSARLTSMRSWVQTPKYHQNSNNNNNNWILRLFYFFFCSGINAD